ncbi:MAG: alpha/beta hydrolase [Actinomycetota bacterium]|nr:alpha/beta hydrolase [Actinomycetota bacterium]
MTDHQITTASGLDICFETFGSSDDPTILLVMGFTAQMTAWDDGFCAGLADTGHHVVRFDNRDCGLSSKFDGQLVDIQQLMVAGAMGTPLPEVPYDLSDMGADGFGLLDALGIDAAHLVGASMGGMIVQQMAIDQPDRVLSLTSIMSTTGNPDFMESSEEAMAALLAPPPADRDGYVEAAKSALIWTSKKHSDLDEIRARAGAAYDRSFYPEGAARQMGAIAATGDREEGLAALDVPTLVIHGRDDTLIRPAGGLRTAEVVPGAHMLFVGDMGHDLPRPLHPLLVDSIAGHTERATANA